MAALMRRARLIIVSAASMAVLFLAVSCAGESSVPAAEERPDTVAVAHLWPYQFTTLEEMVATSDLVVVGEVTAIERGPMPTDDPDAIGLRNVTVTISETLKGTAPGATVVIGEAGYYPGKAGYFSGGSYELADMPWSRLGDIGVFSLLRHEGQPADHFVHIHPDGRMLTHYRGEDGQSQMYTGTVETFSHTALGEVLTKLVPEQAAAHVRQAAVTVETEQIQPQRTIQELIFGTDPDDSSPGETGNTGSGDNSEPGGPGSPSTAPGSNKEVTE